MPEPIISVSGLRGIVGESLSPVTAIRYVAAFTATLPDGPVVVTRDGPVVLTDDVPRDADAIEALMASSR